MLWRILLGCLIVFLCSAGTAAVFVSGELRTLRDALNLNPSIQTGGSLAPTSFGGPETMLLVGNDQRKRTTTTPVLPHSNEMLLVRFDPGKPYISMMSIPRELMVTIRPRNSPAVTTRLNYALTAGGIPLLLSTIEQLTGLRVNHVVEIDFNQFKNAVNEMGCVYSTVDRRYYHMNVSGGPQYQEINLQPGYQKLCGANALSFVSYRHGDTSLVRDARDQSFLLDVKREYGPTLVDNVHKFEQIFGRSVQTDHALHTSSGILDLLGTLISSSSLHVRQVQFQVTLQPTGANPCSCDTASPGQIAASVHAFLYGGSAAPPPNRVVQAANGAHKQAQAKLPLVGVPRGQLSQAVSAAASIPFPLEFPRVEDRAGSGTPSSVRDYTIEAPGGASYPAYAGVFQAGGLGQYYDVQGTTWTTAPLLDSPDQTVKVGHRTYYLDYEGQHLQTVAWYEHGAAYWVRNTLTDALGNGELLAIAEQSAPATARVGRRLGLGAAAVPQRTVTQTDTGLKQTLGSLGGLMALAALPLLAIPLLRRRREVAKLRAQLAATLHFESRLSALAPAPAVPSPQPAAGPRVQPPLPGPGGQWSQPAYSRPGVGRRTKLLAGAGALALAALGTVGLVLNVEGTQHSGRSAERRVVQTIPSVPIAVLNATPTPGAAGKLGRQLKGRGVKIARVGNLSQARPPGLLILYAPDARGEAVLLARMLAGRRPTVEPIDPVAQAAAGSQTRVVVVIA